MKTVISFLDTTSMCMIYFDRPNAIENVSYDCAEFENINNL